MTTVYLRVHGIVMGACQVDVTPSGRVSHREVIATGGYLSRRGALRAIDRKPMRRVTRLGRMRQMDLEDRVPISVRLTRFRERTHGTHNIMAQQALAYALLAEAAGTGDLAASANALSSVWQMHNLS